MARPRILDGETCYKLYCKLGSIEAVRAALFQEGVYSPFSKSKKFAPSAIVSSIKEWNPKLEIDARVPAVIAAQAKMFALKRQMASVK